MRNRPSRPWTVVLALLAGAWSLALLPMVQLYFSGSGMPLWLARITLWPLYRALEEATQGLDGYLVFGVLVAPAFLLLWLATGPVFARIGWSGRVLGWLLLATGVASILSYLNHPADAPLHALWGAEGLLLVVVGAWGFVVAAVAPRERVPLWERIVIGLTLLVAAVSTALLGYWPHGTLVGVSLEFAALAAFAPRADAPAGPAPKPARNADGPVAS